MHLTRLVAGDSGVLLVRVFLSLAASESYTAPVTLGLFRKCLRCEPPWGPRGVWCAVVCVCVCVCGVG